MDELLATVIEAHGGLDRWSRVSGITANMTIGGPFWEFKGQPGILGDETIELDTQREHIRFSPFGGAGRTLEFDVDPERVRVSDADGTVVEERVDPRPSFAGYDVTSKWDVAQVGYFISYAIWNYLTEPFLLADMGVQAHEIEPWEGNGQTWRGLAVTFPPSVVTHNRGQVFYYDTDGMQHRMDYAPEVNGGVLVAQYQYDPKTFDGIVVPTRRLIHRRLQDGTTDQTVAPITLDIHEMEYHTS